MANLIIKSSADNLVLQGSDASPAITVGATGTTTFAENATLSGTANVYGAGTFPTGSVVKHQQVLTAISSDQILTTSYVDITGSSITYTPATGASFIVYECSFVMCGTTAHSGPIWAFKFLIDGTITKNQDSYTPHGDGLSAEWVGPRTGHKMMYSASGWTSDKVVKMQARDYADSSNGGQLHSSFYDYLSSDGSNIGSTDRKTDVITTIYSVM